MVYKLRVGRAKAMGEETDRLELNSLLSKYHGQEKLTKY